MSKKRCSTLMLLLTVLLAAMAAVAVGSPAQAATFGTYHEIPSYYTGKCLDLKSEDNLTLQLWSCSGGSEQQWSVGFNDVLNTFIWRSKRTGECLSSFSTEVGAQVSMGPCENDTFDQWKVFWANNTGSGWHQVMQNFMSGLCLDTTLDNDFNGTLLRQYPCNKDDIGQHWKMMG